MIEFTNLERVLQEYIESVKDGYKDLLKKDGHYASGELINTMKCKIEVQGNLYVAELHLQDYWKYVENGTKPHWPPPSAILKWIEVKKIIPHEINGITPTKEQLSYLIGRKISRVGTKGGLELTQTLNQLNNTWTEKISNALEMDIAESLDEIMIEIK